MDLSSITKIFSIAFVVTVPFSRAANSLGLVCMATLVLVHIFQENGWKQKSKSWIWVLLPLVYLFSQLYSKDHARGWLENQKFIPLIIIPVFAICFFSKENIQLIGKWFLIAIGVHAVLTSLQICGLPILTSKSLYVTSIFYQPFQLIWFYFAAGVLSAKIIRSIWLDILILSLALGFIIYLGHPGLALMLLITSLVIRYIESQQIDYKMCAVYLIPVLVIVLLLSTTTIKETTNSFLIWGNGISAFWTDILYSLTQWWKHLFTGVGIGNHDHALWNEFNINKSEYKLGTQSQIMHLLVSTGLIGFSVLVLIFKQYFEKRSGLLLSLTFLTILFFFVPFQSQITASIFALLVSIIFIE